MKRSASYIIVFVIASLLGFFVQKVMNNSTSRHWRVIEAHNAYINDHANRKFDPAQGFSYVDPPMDPEPSVAALVAAGELRHFDLVFPTVPRTRESSRYWMQFCNDHNQIVYATGNPSYAGIKVIGDPPLHLNLWCRPADEHIVRKLVKDLQTKFEKSTTPQN